jgi:hypothetical protein
VQRPHRIAYLLAVIMPLILVAVVAYATRGGMDHRPTTPKPRQLDDATPT